MSISLTINNTVYPFPETSDTDWGDQVTEWATAVTTGMLQKSGGSFTLLAEVDFGATYGLKSSYYKSRAAATAVAGVVRLGNDESISWRNAADSGDRSLKVNASNLLEFNGVALQEAFTVSDTSKIDLTYSANVLSATIVPASITNSDINASAAIAYSKLSLANSIVNADIATSAAVARSKLASGTANHVVINDGSGVMSSEANLAISRGGTGAGSKVAGFDALSPMTTLGDVIVGGASGTGSRVGIGSTGQVLTVVSGSPAWATNPSAPTQSYELSNLGLASSVGASALTISLKQANGSSDPTSGAEVKIGFRSSTVTSGAYVTRLVSTATSITVTSGATLGHINATTQPIYIYAIDNAGTVELAVSSTLFQNETALYSTTAMTAASDSFNVLYSTTARTNVTIRLIGYATSSQTTAGTWASNLTLLSVGDSASLSSAIQPVTFSASTPNALTTASAIIVYNTKAWDSHNAYNTSTGLYTVPVSGTYTFNCAARISSASLTVGFGTLLRVDVDGTEARYAASVRTQTASAFARELNGSVTLQLNAGQTVGIRLISDASVSVDTGVGPTSFHYFSGTRISN